jgi:hypothetical protein
MSSSAILKEHKVMEKSIADSVDKLSWVDPQKIDQFTDLTYTEVTNFTYLLYRAQVLKNCNFPFVRTIRTPEGKEIEVPLTYQFGQAIEEVTRGYMQRKISMGRKSRQETVGVSKAFGAGMSQERQGILSRIRGAFHL